MLQLILRAEVDKNREAKRLKQTRQQKNQKNNVYSSISKDSVLKKHDEEMLTKETFDFLIDYLVQKDANHRIVCGFSDLITIRGKQLLNQQNVVSDIQSKVAETNVLIKYQSIVSPSDGVVFDLKPKAPGFVGNTVEPIMKIVPIERLKASIEIDSKDIGFETND